MRRNEDRSAGKEEEEFLLHNDDKRMVHRCHLHHQKGCILENAACHCQWIFIFERMECPMPNATALLTAYSSAKHHECPSQ